MPTIFPSQPYKGTRDYYPDDTLSGTEDFRKRQYIFDSWQSTLKNFGFSQYDASLLENADIYIAKSGEELGGKQLYEFHDKGDRHIALRPEMTPTLARLVANKFGELRFPLRWFSIPNCFRYEQPQKGRFREHWQLNVDIIGLEAGPVELELLNVLGEVFKSFGANKKHFKIMFNHRKILDTWLENNNLTNQKFVVYKVLDDWFKLSLEDNTAKLQEGGISDKSIEAVINLTKKEGKSWEEYLEIANTFEEIKLILDTINTIQPDLEYEFNPCIIRGIAYYTGIVFEAFDKNSSNPRSLFGGGRYDDLMELFGKSAPAIGFGWGDATMHEFLTNWNLYPDFSRHIQKVGLMPFSEKDLTQIYTKIIPTLKSEGKVWDIDYSFDRSENKRWETLKKRGCGEIIKIQN